MALFKEGTQVAPQRTLNWKLGVEARFETGLTWVPSFSSSFSGAETMVGRRVFGIINYPDSKYAAETRIGCTCHPYPFGTATCARPISFGVLGAEAPWDMAWELVRSATLAQSANAAQIYGERGARRKALNEQPKLRLFGNSHPVVAAGLILGNPRCRP